jgi:uncharacterized iron-regulated membrane protein
MRRWWFSIHKWVGLIVGLQVLAWMVSGLFMTAVPIEQVRSEHNIRQVEPINLRDQSGLVSAGQAMSVIPGVVTRVELGELLGAAVWRIDIEGKPTAIVDAKSGAIVSPLAELRAREIAKTDFAGGGAIVSAALIAADPPIEYRGVLPVWQIIFDDEDETHLYVSPLTGKVTARRSGVWRLYDFLWSLHIMDYETRDNFNNWLVILTTAVGLLLTVTGIGILVYRFWPSLSRKFLGES